jgi:hypothetical protein
MEGPAPVAVQHPAVGRPVQCRTVVVAVMMVVVGSDVLAMLVMVVLASMVVMLIVVVMVIEVVSRDGVPVLVRLAGRFVGVGVDVRPVAAGVAMRHRADLGDRHGGGEAARQETCESGSRVLHHRTHIPGPAGAVSSEYESRQPAGCVTPARAEWAEAALGGGSPSLRRGRPPPTFRGAEGSVPEGAQRQVSGRGGDARRGRDRANA